MAVYVKCQDRQTSIAASISASIFYNRKDMLMFRNNSNDLAKNIKLLISHIHDEDLDEGDVTKVYEYLTTVNEDLTAAIVEMEAEEKVLDDHRRKALAEKKNTPGTSKSMCVEMLGKRVKFESSSSCVGINGLSAGSVAAMALAMCKEEPSSSYTRDIGQNIKYEQVISTKQSGADISGDQFGTINVLQSLGLERNNSLDQNKKNEQAREDHQKDREIRKLQGVLIPKKQTTLTLTADFSGTLKFEDGDRIFHPEDSEADDTDETNNGLPDIDDIVAHMLPKPKKEEPFKMQVKQNYTKEEAAQDLVKFRIKTKARIKAAMNDKVRNRRYVMYSDDEKKAILEFCSILGEKFVAQELELERQRLRYILKNGPERKKGGGRKIISDDLENAVLAWIEKYVDKHNDLPHRDLCMEEARKIAADIKLNEPFRGSLGWFVGFAERNRSRLASMSRDQQNKSRSSN